MQKNLFRILLPLFLLTIICAGCVEKKVAVQNAFYSTQAPSITIKFTEDVKAIGEEAGHSQNVTYKRYHYAEKDESNQANRIAFFEIDTIPNRFYFNPKIVPGGSVIYSNIYTENLGGEKVYCKISVFNPNKSYFDKFYNDQGIALPDIVDTLSCSMRVADTKKASFLYMRKANLQEIDKVFDINAFNPNALTTEQSTYFDKVRRALSSEINARKFKEGDLPHN